MTIPTTNVGLSAHIKTEFEAVITPVPLSQFYRGGGIVPIGTATSAVDGTPISTSGAIRMGMFRGVSYAGIVAPVSGLINIQQYVVAPQNVNMGVTFGSDGVFDPYGGISSPAIGNWYSPTTTGIGSSYWFRVTGNASGFYTGVALNTWFSLSTARTLSWVVNTGQTGLIDGVLVVDISTLAGTGGIVASHDVNYAFERAI